MTDQMNTVHQTLRVGRRDASRQANTDPGTHHGTNTASGRGDGHCLDDIQMPSAITELPAASGGVVQKTPESHIGSNHSNNPASGRESVQKLRDARNPHDTLGLPASCGGDHAKKKAIPSSRAHGHQLSATAGACQLDVDSQNLNACSKNQDDEAIDVANISPHSQPSSCRAANSGTNPEDYSQHGETNVVCDIFSAPLIAEIREAWMLRQDMVRAQQKLTLQIKAICRRFVGGDVKEADKLYKSIGNGMLHPLAPHASMATAGLRAARAPLEDHRKQLEKHLAKLGKQLPIAHMADSIRGVNYNTLATIVGELGDLSAYEKGVSGIWKRAGLAVINGERQKRKADRDSAILHGYSPSRRSVFWNMADALLKSQGKDDAAGPYRKIYDERKAYERPRVETDAHAHNRAMRHMTKALLKDLWQEWRAVNGAEK